MAKYHSKIVKLAKFLLLSVLVIAFLVSQLLRLTSTKRFYVLTGVLNESSLEFCSSGTKDRIYFMETSGRNNVSFRQSCAVESAARQNPNRPVFLFVSSENFSLTSRSTRLLRKYDNIQIQYINMTEYFSNTPLEKWYKNAMWRSSPYSTAHLADYLRVLAAFKDGGQYLDLDFIVTRPLDGLRNYVVYETNRYFCNGVFHFDKGHPIIEKMVERLAAAYDPHSWAGQGPEMVTDVIRSNCDYVSDGIAFGPRCGKCVRLVDTDFFLPVSYKKWKVLFKNSTSDDLPEWISRAYAVHMWNKLSAHEPVVVGSSQYYARLAAKYCPLSATAASDVF